MSIIEQQRLGQAPEPPYRVFTVADLAAMPSELPSGPVLYELDHGRLVTMTPPDDVHCAIETKIAAKLYILGEVPGHGKARCGEVAIVLKRNPDHVNGADAVFIANRSLPIRRSPEGYLETMPDLVVEVRSKNESGPKVKKKVEEYLEAGVGLVWVADPKSRTVTAYRRDQEPQVFGEADTLTLDELIPGFAMSVEEVFRE